MENCNQVVKFLDVGHGDSSVIYLRENEFIHNTIIIDIPQSEKLLRELQENNVKVIDLIVITHSDSDHTKGINDFLEKFTSEGKIKSICFNIDKRNTTKTMVAFLRKFMEHYQKYKIKLISGINDSDILERKLLVYEDVNLTLLYPNQGDNVNAYLDNDANDMSIVCMLSNNDYNILFSGDLGIKGWNRLLTRTPNLSCEILKLSHHGAFYQSTNTMIGTNGVLDKLKPKVGIISTGQNEEYRHPREETIKALSDKKIKIFCTQYTKLCHPDVCSGHNICCGDICVIRTRDSFTIKTQNDNYKRLDYSPCIN
ncbi:ComEC/Rec2 family competence protein [Lacrimispora sp.]|uniref:ComEC/Rec2 family competence protein n=1 Tax=Lacrimispora sp. TaxID=2719234 RepID=UPI0028B0FBB7|nr:MBL fold metallo-hydrolase [Lacrimispora sp.]